MTDDISEAEAWKNVVYGAAADVFEHLRKEKMTNDIVDRLRERPYRMLNFDRDTKDAANQIERLRKALKSKTPKWNKMESIPKDRPSLVMTKHGVSIQVLPTKDGGFIEEWHGNHVMVHDFYAWREIITSKEIGDMK